MFNTCAGVEIFFFAIELNNCCYWSCCLGCVEEFIEDAIWLQDVMLKLMVVDARK